MTIDKDTGATEKSEKKTEDPRFVLSRLHQEYLRGCAEAALEVERQLEGALNACLDEMRNIETAAATEISGAAEAFTVATRDASPSSASDARREYERQLTAVTTRAREKAAHARKLYLDAWRKIGDDAQALRHKARVDYLGRAQEVWKAVDLKHLGPEAIEAFVLAQHVGHEVASDS